MLIVGDIRGHLLQSACKMEISLAPNAIYDGWCSHWHSCCDQMPEYAFRKGMAIVIFISVIMMVWWDRRKSKNVPQHISFAGIMGPRRFHYYGGEFGRFIRQHFLCHEAT